MTKALLLVLACAGGAFAAIDYAHWSHPAGDFTIEYPSDWKRSSALQAVNLQPPGKEGDSVVISLERYPLGKSSPSTPKDYVKALLDPVGKIKKLDSRDTATVAGVTSEKLVLEETKDLKGVYGQKLPGPMKEVHLVVPQKDFYYDLSLKGVGKSFEKALPEYERVVKTLKLKIEKGG